LNKNKLNNIVLRSGIDTFSIITPEKSQTSLALLVPVDYISNEKIFQNSKDNITRFQYVLNPNKTIVGEVYSYKKFIEVLEYILNEMQITDYYKNRVDFRVDSFQDDYDELLKLNKCIILMFSLRYKIKNCFQSFNPLTFEKLTIRIQNQYIEVENYNKKVQEPDGDVKNRLEFRSKSISKQKEIPDLINTWINKLDDLADCYKELQDRCNVGLVERWNIEKNTEVKTISEFIRKYQGSIFCRRQLVDFLEKIKMNNPSKVADNFKVRNKIEYFSLQDIKMYLKKVETSLLKYLTNE
jgi:hypothetical protein